jgi:RNA-directed DNA polymerase
MKPILSLRDLSRRLRTPLEVLRAIADDVKSHYHSWSQANEKTSKVRIFRAPSPDLMRIQKMINANVLSEFALDESAHGGVKGRSPRTNAAQHLNHSLVITIDVRSFFPNVRHGVVYRMFRHELGFGRDVASLLTRLTTLDAQLPQGAPTSTTIANMILTTAVDSLVTERAHAVRSSNTRFVDDFAFSGPNSRSLINVTAKALSRKRLPIWRNTTNLSRKSKLKIMPQSGPQLVTGLTVNGANPSVPRGYRGAVRSAIHQLPQLPPGAKRDGAVASIRGKIRYVAGFNPGAARRLSSLLVAWEDRPRHL